MPEETIGNKIDRLYATRAKRLALEKDVNALKLEEDLLGKELIGDLDGLGMEAARGSTAMFSIAKKVVADVEDWNKVYEFIKKDNAFDLLQRRLGTTAWKEYLDSGLLIPGTRELELTKYNLTKSR